NNNATLLKTMCCWSLALQQNPPEEALPEGTVLELKKLTRKFSLLKINPVKSLTTASISADRFQTTIIADELGPIVSLETIDAWNVIKLKEYLTQGGDPNITVIFDQPLLLYLFLKATSQCGKLGDYDCMEAQLFYLLLKHALLNKSCGNSRQSIQAHLIENTTVKAKLLHHAQRKLSQELGMMMAHYDQQVKSLEAEFDNILLFAGLQQLQFANQSNTKEPNEVSPLDSPKKILAHLCIGSTPYNKVKTFNMRYISSMVYGLLSEITAKKMIAHIKKMWPNFNSEQKLIANFIIKELIIIDFYRNDQKINEKSILFLLDD
ncbi:MAG TPA: hypothetical protein PLD88_05905, partial [Candidatus Berkiella sp.]|nr:hypothetical protein [Candidatus Berkiella sp.]